MVLLPFFKHCDKRIDLVLHHRHGDGLRLPERLFMVVCPRIKDEEFRARSVRGRDAPMQRPLRRLLFLVNGPGDVYGRHVKRFGDIYRPRIDGNEENKPSY